MALSFLLALELLALALQLDGIGGYHRSRKRANAANRWLCCGK
jgi:hypothetical protein